ncbi:alpha/beta fold hydrolase [Kitasatospora sp. NPDC094011]|uniref:alpha/beta fold hydrolase n=1 Tax=Kitasatospora sp. NPDC094011 TaxID=3364090 RepID=UPI00382EA11F
MSARTDRSPAPHLAPFLAAYDRLLARWPVPVEPLTVRTAHGTTRVNACGPADGRPLVLLHGGGATSTMWFANAGAWAEAGHRVLAVDLIGDPGRSVHDGTPLGDVPGLHGWLDAVLDRLGVAEADFCGHSYGCWLALTYTLHAPARVGRLALLDPSLCFARYRPGYLLHALPLFLPGRTPARAHAFLDWETAGSPRTDPDWREVYALGYADFPASRVITGPRPTPARLGTLTTPLLALYADRSRALDPHRAAEATRRAVPHATVTTVPGATHHNVPVAAAPEVNRQVLTFLTRPTP